MTDRENLPTKAATRDVVVPTEQRGSLVARGLVALRKDNDALYRQARVVFDRGDGIRDWNAVDNPAISSAFNIFRQLADQKYGKAYYPLSILYGGCQNIEAGQTRAKHFTQMAIEWCLANQANEDVELWCDLGDMYRVSGRDGYGVEQDDVKAEIWFRKAAEHGDRRGQSELGMLLVRDGGPQENVEAYSWIKKAAERGHVWMQVYLGDMYDLGGPFEEAVYWFRKAAEQGNAGAQVSLGEMYKEGRGVERDDEQAVYWFRMAAEQGDERGQWKLGCMYSEMYKEVRGVSKDDKQAVYWFSKAAEQGYERGQWELGSMYEEGRGVGQDIERAVYWYRKAAEQGDAIAQNYLGVLYGIGEGVPQSDKLAIYWFIKAAEQGNPDAQEHLRILGIDWKK